MAGPPSLPRIYPVPTRGTRVYSPSVQLLSAGNAPTILNRRDNMEMPDAQIDRAGLGSAENVRHYG